MNEGISSPFDVMLPNCCTATQHRLIVLCLIRNCGLSILQVEICSGGFKMTRQRFNVDRNRVQLIPLYASPRATAAPRNIKFNAEGTAVSWLSISFDNLTSLFGCQPPLRFRSPIEPLEYSNMIANTFRHVQNQCDRAQVLSR